VGKAMLWLLRMRRAVWRRVGLCNSSPPSKWHFMLVRTRRLTERGRALRIGTRWICTLWLTGRSRRL
jgi:hypothetical protein